MGKTCSAEEPIPQDETTVKDDGAEGDADDYAKDEQTEAAVAEVTSEQPRSLGTEILSMHFEC